VTNLKPNTTYYFQLFASNALGTTVGSIQSITTSNDATSQVRAALPTANSVTVSTGMGMRPVHFAQ
jgi:phosphodiesterase/alkaline phosphatase D-like protein